MAKQLSWKQQMYQDLANSQVQQVIKEQRDQDYKMAQDLIAQYQPTNDDITLAQNLIAQYQQPAPQPAPIKQTTVNEVKAESVPRQQIPSLEDFFTPTTASGKNINKESAKYIQRNSHAKQQQIENELASKSDSKKKEPKVGQRPEATDFSSQVAARVTNEKKPEINTANVPVNVDRWLSPDTKLTEAEKKKAKEYASAELQKVQYGPNKQPLLNTPEERQHYADMVNLINKTNGFTNFMSAGLESFYNLADTVSDKARSAGNQLGGLGAAITDKLGVTEGATQRHNEQAEIANQFAEQNEANMRQSFKNAQTQDPGAYTTGKIAGQTAMYMLTNPVFDGIAAGAGVESELAKFFINQGAQNVQDLVLDTAPTVRQLMEDGSTPEEIKKEALNNILWNAAGNAVLGGLGAWAGNRAARKASDEAFRENVRAGADNLSRIANEIPGIEDVDNVVRNATRQAEEATKNIENIAQQIPKLPEENYATDIYKGTEPFSITKDPYYLTQEEFEAGQKRLQDYLNEPSANNKALAENDIKQNSFGPDIDNALNDIQSFVDGFSGEKELHKELTDSLDEVKNAIRNGGDIEGARAKLDNALNSAAEIVQQNNDSLLGDITSEAFQKVKSATDGSVIRLNKSVLKDVLGDDAIFSDLNSMVYTGKGSIKFREGSGVPIDSIYNELRVLSDYELPEAHAEADQVAAIAKYISDVKAKNITPDNSAINEVKRLGNSLEEVIGSYNPNRFVEDVSKRSVPGANPLQTFAEKDNAQEQLRQLELARQRSLLDVNEELKQSLPEYYGWNLGADRAYHERIIDGLKTADEKEDEALDALTNYVNRQRNSGGNNTPTRGNNSPTPTRPIRNIGGGNGGGTTPPSNPLNNNADDQWKISKARKNTFENQGWGDQLPEKDFAYRVQSTADTHEIKNARYQGVENVANELLNKDYDTFDAADVKASMEEIQKLMDSDDIGIARRLAERLAHEGREGGRTVQAFREYNKNNITGALRDATNAEEDLVLEPWRSRNVKKREGNSRIAKALADMGHKPDAPKEKVKLTHDQIKAGVRAEIEREVGSVEKYFNDNDIEFLTEMAEDKKIPVWQITSEIEHKLNTGNWYTLDESIDLPKPTNTKLMNALNSLVTEQVRAEKPAPTLQQITEEVRNTLAKEFGEGEETLSLFGDEDIEYLANLINNGATKQELANALDHKLATGKFGISNDTLREVNAIFKEISNFDPNSKQFVEGQLEAYRLLANEVVGDATPLEKFEAWRYLAMLGNPKTMLRNFIGNQMFGAVTGISNNIAALGEAGIDKGLKALGGEGIQRTKSVLNPLKDMDLIKAAAEDADASRYRQIIGSKYEKFSQDTLRQQKSVFNNKLLQLYEKVTDAGISDYQAVKNKFSTSLAGYLKANGLDKSVFNAETELARLKNLSETRLLSDAEKNTVEKLTKDVETLEKARDYALKQAEYATFHEDNAFAKWLTKTSQDAPGPLRAMIEGVVPFKKTPANVLRSGLEYSPLGAIDSIKKTGKLIYENTGKRAGNLADTYINSKGKEVAKTLANDVIESWSRTLTGTGLTALGFYLLDKGILQDSDPDTKYQDQLEGLQNYSIKIGDKTYTVDWAAPAVMPLLLGAEIAKVWNSSGNDTQNWYDHLDEYLNAANRMADPIIETSMLQGVKDTLETAANAAKYNENLNIPTLLAYNTATGYLTQGVPTALGQIARTVDNTRRSTYTDKEGVAGTLEKQGRKLMNKIPGLSQFNQPYIDTYGRQQNNSPFGNPAANLAYQMVSPGYLANINTTDADRMSRDVYEKSGKSENVLPQWKSYFKYTSGERYSPEDYTKASKIYGNLQMEVRDALAKDEWFNGLSDEDKTEIVDDINTLASNVAKASIDPEFSTTSKPFTKYQEGGLQGLMDHFKNRQASDAASESGLNSSTKAAQAIKEDILNGNTEAAQEKIDEAQQLNSLGLNKPGPTYTYYTAKEVIPSLTTEDFAKTYKAIDSNSNQGITQDELISYMNNHNISESEGKKLWKAYGSSKWKKIPTLKDGTWKKSK